MAYENKPWHAEHKEEMYFAHRERYKLLRQQGLCVCCGVLPAEAAAGGGNGGKTLKYCTACANAVREYQRAKVLSNRIKVLTHYGKNGTLQCCWDQCTVTDIDMLSLDHINNDGSEQRKLYKCNNNLYASLEKRGWPDDLQTLCHNHQWKKEMTRRRANLQYK